MAVRWESLRGGVVLLVVAAAFGWATLWPAATEAVGQKKQRVRQALPPTGGRAGQVWVSPAGIELVWVPAGEFQMGSNNGYDWEKPVHRVRLTRSFWLGRYEVTQGQWEAMTGFNPSHFKGCPACPMEMVSWDDCQLFVKELNKQYPLGEGLVWRLPTEAEWEYACRAGTTGEYAGDLEAMAWYGDNSGERRINAARLWDENRSSYLEALERNRCWTHEVGKKRPNGWGLYDMHGNVSEWCADWCDGDYYSKSPEADPRGPVSGEYRVLRGGAWNDFAYCCRTTFRGSNSSSIRYYNFGLRVAVGAP